MKSAAQTQTPQASSTASNPASPLLRETVTKLEEIAPAKESKELSTVVKLQVPGDKAPELAKKAIENYEKSQSKEELSRNFLETVKACLEPTSSGLIVSVTIPAVMNSLIITNSSLPADKRLNTVIGTELFLFAAMQTANLIQTRCKENTANVIKTLIKNATIFSTSFSFAYDTACKMAARYWAYRLPNTTEVNAVLGVSVGGAFALGLLNCFGQSQEPSSRLHKFTGAMTSGLAAEALVSTAARVWKYSSPSSYSSNTDTIFDFTALGTGLAAGIYSLFSSKSNRIAHQFEPLVALLNQVGTCAEALDYQAMTSIYMMIAKGTLLLSSIMVNQCCVKSDKPASNQMNTPLIDEEEKEDDIETRSTASTIMIRPISPTTPTLQRKS